MKNNVYGYARVSTPQQSLGRQIRNIQDFSKDAKIYADVYSGRTMDRPEFIKLLKKVQTGDTIIFDEVSRMSRNAEEGFELYQELFDNGVELIFLKERYIDTDNYRKASQSSIASTGTDYVDEILAGINKALLMIARNQIKIAFEKSQYEVDQLRQRTREGMMTARISGKQIGRQTGSKVVTRKSIETKEMILKYSKKFGGPLQDKEIIKLAGVDRVTYYKYKKELLEGGQEELDNIQKKKKELAERERKERGKRELPFLNNCDDNLLNRNIEYEKIII